jgi:hypothetical protein
MRASGCFAAVLELCFHWRTAGSADHLLRLASTQGGLATALKAKVPEAEEALSTFAALARSVLGTRAVPWTYTYRARIGIT